MFHLLLESNAVPASRVGGSLFSTIGHAALVAAAVALTALPHDRIAPPTDPQLTFVPVPPPAVEPPRPIDLVIPNTNTASGAAGTPSLSTVIEIPIGLPTIDLSIPVTRLADFSGGPRGRPDGTGEPGTRGQGDGSAFSAEQVDRAVLMRPGAPTPSYPEMLRTAGIAGGVVVEFIVDTLGRVEIGSIRLVHADHELFAASVERIVPKLQFLPAEALGHRVRQWVRLPFRFDLHF